MNYQYNYDKMNNITNKTTEHGDYAYDYDDIYRLVDADNPTLDDEVFAYDPVGNRLTAQGVAGTWNYNDNNELLGYDNVSYEYDVNGNMTQKTVGGVVTKFFYNIEDRLERVEDAGGTLIAAYYYDPFGRRLWKEVDGTRTCFLYADEGLIGEYDLTGGEIKTYGYKPGSTWTTDPLFMKSGSEYYFYHNDHLGTPQKMTATNGAVVWSAKYTSFGKVEVELTSTITNSLRFPGQYEDQETGLYYNYYRYYNPISGRYLRIDPLGLKTNYLNVKIVVQEADCNQYLYVHNSPTDSGDYLGLMPGVGKNCPSGQYSCPKKDYTPPLNGCGPIGWKTIIVKCLNKPLGGYVDFTDSCIAHDKCYGKCNANRDTCDDQFLEALSYACYKKHAIKINMLNDTPIPIHRINEINPFYQSCLAVAVAYSEAVHLGGVGPYQDGQNAACYCSDCPCP
jgi:RHS repeat-associated protein